MGNNTTTYVGMDVHARSISARALVKETGECPHKDFVNHPSVTDIAEWLETLPQPVYCAYESGCTGFWLARKLRELGFECDVIAVSTLPRSTKDRQQKCDKLDAKSILREIANPASDYTTVYIPSPEIEGARNLMRAYAQAKENLKHDKQHVLSFLLTYGYVWCEKTRSGKLKKQWSRDFIKWLDSITFNEKAAQTTYLYYRQRVRDSTADVKRLREQIRDMAEDPENKPYVDAFRCVKGIDVETAMTVRAEFGDFLRFSSGRKVSCWAGMVPSNSSSGERDVHGKITKAGNKYLRRALIEGLTGISVWRSGKKAIPKGVEIPGDIQEIVSQGNERIFDRYMHLYHDNHLHANKAKVAVANELVRWLWVIGCQIQQKQQQSLC